jgi:hypothetical protein
VDYDSEYWAGPWVTEISDQPQAGRFIKISESFNFFLAQPEAFARYGTVVYSATIISNYVCVSINAYSLS